MSFGKRLKELRNKRGLTQSQFGEMINVTKASVSGYENGTRNPDKETLINIAKIFNVTTDFLLGVDINQNETKPLTIAAHIDDDVTDEEMEDILNYIEFIKNKHRK